MAAGESWQCREGQEKESPELKEANLSLSKVMVISPPMLSLRDMLIQRQVIEQHRTQTQESASASSEFEDRLRNIGRDYEVNLVGFDLPHQTLAGRPLQLLLQPRNPQKSVFQIRITGVVTASVEFRGGIAFKPISVDITPPERCRTPEDFRDEADSAEDVIGHVHRVLNLLHHPDQSAVTLHA